MRLADGREERAYSYRTQNTVTLFKRRAKSAQGRNGINGGDPRSGEEAVYAGFGLEQTQRSARRVGLTTPIKLSQEPGYGYGIGIGRAKQAETGAYFGKWVKVRLPNGQEIVRQVNETSSRPYGIELVTPHTDESSYGSGKAKIIGVYDQKPTMQVHIHNTLNVNGLVDSQHARHLLSEHADHIGRLAQEHLRDHWGSQIVV